MIKFQKTYSKDSLVTKYCQCPDYADQFSVIVRTKNPVSFEDLLEITFFNDIGWVKFLFKLRNLLVKPFGLEIDILPQKPNFNDLKEGDFVSFFQIVGLNSKEILLGGTDKHLSGWLSLEIEPLSSLTQIKATTIVRYTNFFGRAYFFLIQPFHVLIMKSKMRKLEHHLNMKPS